jgi:hypothetical protein
MIAGVLVPLAVLLAARSILNFKTSTSITPTSPIQESTINETTAKNKSRSSSSLDPTLHYAQLKLTEDERYEGSGRNIFQIDAEARTARISPEPEPIPPAPAVKATVEQTRLRFFGFALIFNSPRKVFLSEGDAIFVGSEGEIVDRRYRIGKIGTDSVQVEDLIDHSVHTLWLAG